MSPFLFRAFRIGVCVFALAGPTATQATVLYQFAPITMGTPPGAPYTVTSVVGSLELTDAAFAAGSFTLADIVAFSFQVNDAFVFTLTPTVPNPPQIPPDPIPPQASGLVSPTGTLTDGHIVHLTSFDWLDIVGDSSGLWTGFYITDRPPSCNLTEFPCQFTGTWEIVPVSEVYEPASLALLAASCLGAVWMSRRRRTAR
jgi:hypothetical protein